MLARGLRFAPPGPEALGRSFLATQKWTVHGGTRTYRFTAYFELSPQKATLVGLTPAGTRAFSLTLDAEGVHYEHLPFFRLPIDPAEMLALAQLAFWPEDAVRRGLDSKIRFMVEAQSRILTRGRREIVRVVFDGDSAWRGTVRVHNLVKGQLLEVRTLRVD